MTKAPIQIRNPDVVRDIRALADRTGLPLTEAVADAVRRRLLEEDERDQRKRSASREKVRRLVARFAALPRTGPALSDSDLYDEDGFPR